MMKRKMPAALLAGLILLSLAGCGADKVTPNSNLETESHITETVTESAPKSTAEIDLPAAETTAEKEKAENAVTSAPVTNTETKRPAESPTQPTTSPKATEVPKATEPQPTAPPESQPAETTAPTVPPVETKPETEPPVKPSFNINYWINYAKNYAISIGLVLNPDAVECWDNPMVAGPKSKCLERDIKGIMNRYKNVEGFTDVWVWAEPDSNGSYRLFIGYA